MSSNWQFEKKEVDDGTGWNSPVITGFKKNKLKSLTCEILQNSLDNPANEDGAVRVTFSQRVVAREQVPGAHDLESRLAAILEQATGRQSENAVEEINSALQCIKQDQITCLQISDYNTSGMAGPDIEGSDFHRYIKTEGTSGGSESRGGSHGHGKAAPLQTFAPFLSVHASSKRAP